MAMADSVSAKIFVGGMARGTTEDSLRQHFSHFGDVVSCFIIKDRETDNSRGFGFVTFADTSSAERAIESPMRHVIDGRSVDVKRAKPRGEQHQNSDNQLHRPVQDSNGGAYGESQHGGFNGNGTGDHRRTKRVFVGGLKDDHTEEDMRSYFKRFGRIDDIALLYDTATNRSRGFGFVSFESEEVVENILQNNFHEIGGKHVEVKKAIPKEESNSRLLNRRSSSPYGGNLEDMYHHPNNGYDNYARGYYNGFNYHGYQYPMVGYYDMYGSWGFPYPWSYVGMYGTGYYPYAPSAMNGRWGDADSATTSNGIMGPGPSRNYDQDFVDNVELHDNIDSQAEMEQQMDDRARNFDSKDGSTNAEGCERTSGEPSEPPN